uniref:zinc finger protein VAR3, chloroplastic-like isoform X2 n=1 Tax=Erigeron canadensis TaxID=72917 RepID=UPI001CB9B3A0|nr:zinc finger protein VAR3, chloroplastic-like isoform X2 [Erigeron canadensis]
MLKQLTKTLKSLPKNPKSISHIHTHNKPQISNPAIDFILDECENIQSSNPNINNYYPTRYPPKTEHPVENGSSDAQVSHRWPEWVLLMNKLMKFGYFDGVANPFRNNGLVDGKDCNRIRTCCLNFARDRPDLMSYFSAKDIKTVAGSGCPCIDRKVVNSGKRLRAQMGIDEGNVCSSCTLRGNCDRAYVKAREDDGGHTVDVMRVVLAYGLDHITASEDDNRIMNKRLEEAIRSLIKDMVKYSKKEVDYDSSKQVSSVQRSRRLQQEHQSSIPTTQGDWNCPRCMFLNLAGNVNCMRCNGPFLERLQRSRNKQDPVQVQLKKGDWLCMRCSLLNYAKNSRCLQCQTNPPKRQTNPGEWMQLHKL